MPNLSSDPARRAPCSDPGPYPSPDSSPGASPGPSAPRGALSSLTLRGAAAMAVAYAAGRVGLHAGDPAVQDAAATLVDLAFSLGAMAVGVGRARARGPLA